MKYSKVQFKTRVYRRPP